MFREEIVKINRPGPPHRLVEKYETDSNQWVFLPTMCEKRCLHAVAVLDEKMYACGGGLENVRRSAEVYDPSKNSWELIASMKKKRCSFTVVAYQEKLFAIGGDDEKSVEVYDPLKNEWQIDHELSSGLQIACLQGGLISTS